jgi:hypothetical protein
VSADGSAERRGQAAPWRFVGHCFDGEPFAIGGIDVWRTWTATGEQAPLADPIYPWRQYDFPVYTVTDGTWTVESAAGEFSNTVRGFFEREGYGSRCLTNALNLTG